MVSFRLIRTAISDNAKIYLQRKIWKKNQKHLIASLFWNGLYNAQFSLRSCFSTLISLRTRKAKTFRKRYQKIYMQPSNHFVFNQHTCMFVCIVKDTRGLPSWKDLKSWRSVNWDCLSSVLKWKISLAVNNYSNFVLHSIQSEPFFCDALNTL